MTRKIGAWIILILLLVVPFINWRVGALLWMCAWLVYIIQGLSKGRPLVQYTAEEDDRIEEDDDNFNENHGKEEEENESK